MLQPQPNMQTTPYRPVALPATVLACLVGCGATPQGSVPTRQPQATANNTRDSRAHQTYRWKSGAQSAPCTDPDYAGWRCLSLRGAAVRFNLPQASPHATAVYLSGGGGTAFQHAYDVHGIRSYLATKGIRTVEIAYNHGMDRLGDPASASYLKPLLDALDQVRILAGDYLLGIAGSSGTIIYAHALARHALAAKRKLRLILFAGPIGGDLYEDCQNPALAGIHPFIACSEDLQLLLDRSMLSDGGQSHYPTVEVYSFVGRNDFFAGLVESNRIWFETIRPRFKARCVFDAGHDLFAHQPAAEAAKRAAISPFGRPDKLSDLAVCTGVDHQQQLAVSAQLQRQGLATWTLHNASPSVIARATISPWTAPSTVFFDYSWPLVSGVSDASTRWDYDAENQRWTGVTNLRVIRSYFGPGRYVLSWRDTRNNTSVRYPLILP